MFTSAYIFIFLKVLNVYIIHVLPYPYITYGKWKYRTRQLEHVNTLLTYLNFVCVLPIYVTICRKKENASN